ncbi:Vacuolar amino acid transporter 3 [Yarrowia sp. B02]|nr:Vacuolar amino acid transporter 3 [Yarrowia sp. B02]
MSYPDRRASFGSSPRQSAIQRLGTPVQAGSPNSNPGSVSGSFKESMRESMKRFEEQADANKNVDEVTFNKRTPEETKTADTSKGGLTGLIDKGKGKDSTEPSAAASTPSKKESASPAATPADAETQSIHSVDIDNPDPEVVKAVGRHLVSDDKNYGATENENFDSLKLQGGDITRQLYKWQKEHEEGGLKRSKSFDAGEGASSSQAQDINSIKAPGGFRRNFIAQKVQQENGADKPPTFLTRNFIEFLSIYGHFAGEELEEDDEDDDDDDYDGDDEVDENDYDEETPLRRRARKQRGAKPGHPPQGNASATKAVMLLLKSFVGTGVLFLPKAFFNGGLLFSACVLTMVAALSYWCFLLLIQCRMKTGVSSFGDIGGALYGPKMRFLILFSIVISQIGFAAAYIVFTSENLQAFILSVTKGETFVKIETLIFLQLIIFLPLSMIRDIAKLSGTALIADLFILLGLVYLYYWSGMIVATEGVADVKMFNPNSWSLFLGTAIFTFEGIGLIIPIQESMKKPEQFTPVLAGVMVGITALFVSMGAICYMAFGSEVKTVVISNLPQDSKFVNGVQILYSAAILLSTPLQLFPAIRIMENGLFTRSGKYNATIKWQKNIFRFFLVFVTAFVAWGGADDLDRFVALTGSFACVPLVYIYPPLLHYKGVARGTVAKVADLCVFVFGLCAMGYTTANTVGSWIGGN